MNVKPILFNSEMVRALLDGRKTQTRRIIKPQPEFGGAVARSITGQCPKGQQGDLLYVREKCYALELPSGLHGVVYDANDEFIPIGNAMEETEAWMKLNRYAGRFGNMVPSIHMPRWASRLTLKITDVRVERVQDISANDCRAEGHKQRLEIRYQSVHDDAARD